MIDLLMTTLQGNSRRVILRHLSDPFNCGSLLFKVLITHHRKCKLLI